MVTLRLDIPAEKARKIEGTPREVSLTHESIVCLDVSTTTICAIVNHKRWVCMGVYRPGARAYWWSTILSA
jgi:hypothetical protein